KHGTVPKTALEELNREGWETVYKDVGKVLADNEARKMRASAGNAEENASPSADPGRRSICYRMQKTVRKTSMIAIPHFTLLGPPGTGKTTIANLIGRVLNEAGILRKGHTVSVKGSEMISDHVGGTAHLVADKIEQARDGVLFIDEAYGMVNSDQRGGRDFAQAAVDTLVGYSGVEQQEDFPFCLILGGYGRQLEPVFDMNPGLRSRMTYQLELNPYTADHLSRIYLKHIEDEGFTLDEELRPALNGFFESLIQSEPAEDFANARVAVQTIGDELTIRNCNVRRDTCIRKEDFGSQARLFRMKEDGAEKEAERIKREVEEILSCRVGNEDLKKVIRRLVNHVVYNLNNPDRRKIVQPGYYFFVGDPGTGKTTSAEMFAKCLYALGLTKDCKVIVRSAQELVAGYEGQTAANTVKILKESRRRVLLLDEAYALRSKGHGFQDEAMTEITNFLDLDENKHFCCIIFAGYQRDMDALTRPGTGNPGLLGRLQKVIKFSDYSASECVEILVSMAEHGAPPYSVPDEVRSYYEKIFEVARNDEEFSNGRTVRAVYEAMIDNAIERINNNHYANDDPLRVSFTMDDVLSEAEVRLLSTAVADR
ncbi:MAG: AAA family ATPase, partial [Lachnospiraceae bacterium]|nr:AAA family ATPase [Lachnospiraceae bacterium]